MNNLVYLKLGGSLITDKTGVEQVREDVLTRLADEITAAVRDTPDLRLILGHGSGSFGHVAGAKHGTRRGVKTAAQWFGFTEVSDAALRLNRRVVGALFQAGLPALSFSPSASAVVDDGRIEAMTLAPIRAALEHHLVPVVHGDVAFDKSRGGTIVSTEEVIGFLLGQLSASWFLLAGETAGVYDQDGRTIDRITPQNFDQFANAFGGSRGTDVTGGMAAKVGQMLDLVTKFPRLRIKIFSGLATGVVGDLLRDPSLPVGTEIAAE